MQPGSIHNTIKKLEIERDQLLEENKKLKFENKIKQFSISNAPQMISYVDRSLTYRYVNKRYEKIFNISANEFIGKKLQDVIGEKAFEKAQHYVNKVLNGEEVRYLEKYEYPGKTEFIDGHLIPDIDENGKVQGWYAFLNDITEHLERGWQKFDNRYILLTKNLKEELWVADTNLKLTWVSPYCENILGYTAEERLSIQQDKIFGKKAMNRFRNFIKTQKNRDCKMLNNENTISTQLKAKHKNGQNIWVEVKAWFFCNTMGEIIGIQGITRDIHHERLLQEQLSKSENRFKTIFKDDLLVKMIINPKTGSIIDANRAAAKFYGYPLDVLLTMKIQQINKLPREKTKKEMQKAIQKKQNVFNFKHKLANGSTRDVEVYSNPMHFENKTYLFSIIKDITEQKKAEQEINKLLTAVEQSPALTVITDTQGNVEYINKTFSEVTGYAFNEIVGKNMNVLQSGNTPKETYPDLWDTINSGKIWKGEFANKKKNGTVYYEKATIAPVFNKGEIVNFISVKEDITAIKIAEQKLKESEEKYRDIFQNSPLGMFRSTPEGKFIEANPAFAKMLGFTTPRELIHNIYSISKQVYADPKQRKKVLEEASKSDQVKHFENIFKRKDGSEFIVNLYLKPVMDKNSKTIHFEGIVEDISEQREMQISLKQLTADSLYINEKNKFISRLKKQYESLSGKYQFNRNEKDKLEKLFQMIMDTDKDWQQIKTHFETVHKGFYEKLNQKSSNLTQNDLRHCAYIKMNFSTKEIARLMNVKDTSIQRARVRLKKKLGLKSNDDLFTFIRNI